MKPETIYAHTTGLYLSVPTIIAFALFSVANQADDPSLFFLLAVVIVCILALPWTIISIVIFFYAVPMNSGLIPNMEGYYWRVVLAYSAPIITVLGAHYNGFLLGRSKFRNLESKRKKASNHVLPKPENHG